MAVETQATPRGEGVGKTGRTPVARVRDMPHPHAPEHSLLLHNDRLSAERRLAARIADALLRGDKVIGRLMARR